MQRRSAAQIADQNAGIEVRQILQGAPGAKHQIIDHGSHGAAFEHRIAREFSIFVGPSCLYPRLDLKVLILERVRQFVGHDHALVRKGTPVRDIEFTSLRIVETFDLFGEHVHHEGIEVESFGNEAKSLSAARVGIAFHRIFFFVHLLDNKGADFLARAQRLFQRRAELQPGDFAHLVEDFIGGSNKIGLRAGLGGCGKRGDGSFLRANGDLAKENNEAQEQSAQRRKRVF